MLEVVGIGNYFLNITLGAQKIRTRTKVIALNEKHSANQRKQLPESRDSPQNWKEHLTAIEKTKD
jgi:hypothetical protein